MKLKYKFLFVICTFISLFLFNFKVKADYKAYAFNDLNAKCELSSKSTGYCLYENKNLNSANKSAMWLDTGDAVTVLTNYNSIKSSKSECPTSYVYVKFYYNNKTYYGYYCDKYLVSNTLTDELKKEFTDAGFPEDYFEKLSVLKTAHPNWIFKAINTNLNFSDAVKGESENDTSLIQKSNSNNYAYMAVDSISFDYKADKYIAYDDISSSNAWYRANYDTIAYYMDPRNFLSDMYIFQFEGLAYDSTIDDATLVKSINNIFGNDYLNRFSEIFLNAGKQSKVSPIYLSAMSKQEVANGETAGTAINGTYNKMYNFYNIGATSGTNPVYNGLNFAAIKDESTLRPWDTEEKAIIGGALWLADKYISVGQDTGYFKRWNVIYNYLILKGEIKNPYSNYHHQYMTNVLAPSSEALSTYQSYYNSGLINSNFVFYIPVYKNMPTTTTLPTKGGWPNNYLKSISINGINVIDFDGDVINYTYNQDINNTQITISANAVSSKAKVTGTGTFEITSDTKKTIVVTAENGDVRKYNINIKLTGEKIVEATDIITTLNNSGIKNNDQYLYGFNLNTDIKTIKEKILLANKDAQVSMKNSSDKDKNEGIISTGDKVIIKLNDETKTYVLLVYGDTNGDGKITAADYMKIKNHIMGVSKLSGCYLAASDIDKNDKITAADYMKIKNYIMGTGSISQ